jgi:hypothetical protein
MVLRLSLHNVLKTTASRLMSEEWPDLFWILQNLNYLLGIQLEDMTVEYLKNVTDTQVIDAMQEAYSESKIPAKDMAMTQTLLDFLADFRNGLVDENLINDIIQRLIRKRDNNYSQKLPKTQAVSSLLLQLHKLI